MAVRHHAVWDEMGDERFGFGRPPAPRGRLSSGGGLQSSSAMAAGARRAPSAVAAPPAPPSPFAHESVEAKLAMGFAELLAKKGVAPSSAILATGLEPALARLSSAEVRGSRFQRLSRLGALPGGGGKALLNGALPPTARSVEQLTLGAEIYSLEQEAAARANFESQATLKLRHAAENTQRLRAQFEQLLAEREHPSRNTNRQRQYMREHVQKLRNKHDAMVEAMAKRAAVGEDALDADVRSFVEEQSASCERQEALVAALIDKVNGYLRGSSEGANDGLLPSGAVALFGSRATRLSLASSDVDLVLQGELTEAAQRAGGARSVIIALVERLRHEHPDIKFIDAVIPRCTFVDPSSGLTADITAGPDLLSHKPGGAAPLQHSGELASAFVRRLQLEYPALRPLVLILKALLRRAHYHEPFIGGLSSHGLVLMVGTLLRVREKADGRELLASLPVSVLLCDFLFVFGFEFDYSRLGVSLRRGEFFDRVELADFAAPLLVEDPLAEAPEDGTVVNVTHVVTSTQMLQGIFRSAYSMLTAHKRTSLSLMASLEY